MQKINRQLCVAPMMDWTNRHCRFFHRQLAPHAMLYTEMVTANAILFGDKDRLLSFDQAEHPVALQLGGSDPAGLAEASRIGCEYAYDEINLNVGCPSDRVQMGRIGACLMADPELVGQCIKAMRSAVSIPVTVKHRIGIDDQDEEQDLCRFVESVATAGCKVFIVHARKAWLKGLSPKQNRDVPPLNYERVYRLKEQFPELEIIINGGLQSISECEKHLEHVDGVMLGRAAYQRPYLLAELEQHLFETSLQNRTEYIEKLKPYLDKQLKLGVPFKSISRHILGLFQGQPGAKHWRRTLSTEGVRPNAGIDVLATALMDHLLMDSVPESGQQTAIS